MQIRETIGISTNNNYVDCAAENANKQLIRLIMHTFQLIAKINAILDRFEIRSSLAILTRIMTSGFQSDVTVELWLPTVCCVVQVVIVFVLSIASLIIYFVDSST